MNSVYASEKFPRELQLQLELADGVEFIRNTVLVREPGSDTWNIVGCVVRPLKKDEETPKTVIHEYQDAVLCRDVLEASQCISFVESLALSNLSIAARSVQFDAIPQTEIVIAGVRNTWMEQAGTVYTFSPKANSPVPHERLLRIGAPYYPNPHEANKDWLGLRTHSGQSDFGNGKVLFLWPETQGFIADFKWETETLELEVSGTALESESLHVLGALWSSSGIQQLEAPVTRGRAILHIPSDAQRLELFVLGDFGRVYEHHQEQVAFGPQHCRFLGARSQLTEVVSQVIAACVKGECVDVEFKFWVDIKPQLKENSKLMQVLQTLAAFSNTSGGSVYIGVNDNSEIVGINFELARSTQKATDESCAQNYVGALRTLVNDNLRGPVAVTTALADIEGKFVAILNVAPSKSPVSIGSECIFYVRKGATNRKVPPDEWRAKEEKAPWE